MVDKKNWNKRILKIIHFYRICFQLLVVCTTAGMSLGQGKVGKAECWETEQVQTGKIK